MDEQARHQRREFLVILEGERAAEAIDRLHKEYRVSQVGSPRVAVVEAIPAEAAQARSVPGVKVVTDGELPPNATEGLDEGEVLFVQAWVIRTKEFGSKRRRGEGLSWDAPGFEPPDPPLGGSDRGNGE